MRKFCIWSKLYTWKLFGFRKTFSKSNVLLVLNTLGSGSGGVDRMSNFSDSLKD